MANNYPQDDPLTKIDFGNISIASSTSDLTYSGIDTITLTGSSGGNTIDLSGLNNYNWNNPTNWGYTTGYTTTPSSTVHMGEQGIQISETADIRIGNRSLKTFMEKMEERLAILQPDPEKLEKFAALRAAYEHYQTLEALCSGDIPKKPDDDKK